MILRPIIEDYKIVGHFLGKITIGIGITMLFPVAVALIFREPQPAIDFLFSMSCTFLIGILLTTVCYTRRDLDMVHAMSVASLSWIVAMIVSAIPLVLSGHFLSFLDACFETMSGYATTGLTLTVDMDHMSYAHTFWRHFIMFLGGQGIVVIALTFLFKGTPGAFRMYIGEARDEKVLPNVIETARFIWIVSLVYLVIGSAALSITAISGGLKPAKAVFDSVCVFMAAWDTGGFTPQSQSVLFYHSPVFEMIACGIMILGSINFALHYVVWNGNRREAFKNIEMVTFFVTMAATLSVTCWGLARHGVFESFAAFFFKGFFQLVSAHTGTGFSTVYPAQFSSEWGQLAMFGLISAMAIGGSVCSTTGAIKLLRIGIIYKALRQDIKKFIIPESAVLIQKIHHLRDIILEDRHVRAALMIMLLYIDIYIVGTVAGMFYGYPLCESAFESVSAAANVGLSSGITVPSMPNGLKVVYIIQMWAGRLEFMSIFVLGGFVYTALRGRK